MGITTQFRPTQHTYQSTYDPFPFKELAPMAMKMQQENRAGMDKMMQTNQVIAGSTLAQADTEAGARKVEELTSRVSDLTNNNQSLRSREFNIGLNKVISDYKGDKFFRNSAHNAEMEKKWNKVLQGPGMDADKFAMQQEFQKFQSEGTEGYGLLSEPTMPERKDAIPWLNKIGAKYKAEGEKIISRDADGNPVATESWRGTMMDEIARGYGYEYNASTGQITLKNFAPGFEQSPEGASMRRDADYIAYQKGTEVNDEFVKLYQETTVPMIEAYQYSIGAQGAISAGKDKTKGAGDRFITISGGTIHDPNVPTSTKDSRRLDTNATERIAELDEKIASLDENDPSIRYWQQERNDLSGDMEERASRITSAKKDMNYNAQQEQYVKDAFKGSIWENDPETANEMLENVAYVQEVKSDQRFEGFNILNPEGWEQEIDLEYYSKGEKIIDDLKTMDNWSDVKKIAKKTRKLNKELDKNLKTKAAAITSEQFTLSSFDKRFEGMLLDAYRPSSEWTVIDDKGKHLKDDEKPKSNNVDFKTVYKDEVKGLGYIFTMVDKKTGEEYQVSSQAVNGVGEGIGADLMKEHDVGSAKWTDGARMIYPGYSRDVDRIVTNGGPRTIFKAGTSTEIATVEKIVDGGTWYTINYGGKVLENVPNKNTVLAILDILDKPEEGDEAEIEEILNK